MLLLKSWAEAPKAAVVSEIQATGVNYGHQDDGAGHRIVVDYSAPNIAKRMHVGHIRSTIIGQALVNIYRTLGYAVVGDNHLGDWGKQFGVVLASVERDGKPSAQGEAALEALEAQYARYAAAAKEDPALDEHARLWSLRLEQGDPQARALWQWSVDLTMSAAQRNNYVEVAAFYIAERRGFASANPADDWAAAEAEIDRLIASGHFAG